eukprot:14143-Hanusia_phi.AAC.1
MSVFCSFSSAFIPSPFTPPRSPPPPSFLPLGGAIASRTHVVLLYRKVGSLEYGLPSSRFANSSHPCLRITPGAVTATVRSRTPVAVDSASRGPGLGAAAAPE